MARFFQKKYIVILFGVLLFHLFFLVKLKFTAWPEMLLWPYLIVQGLLPYRDIAIAHTPHLIIDLAIFYKIFGVGILQLKIYTWLLILITDATVYWVASKVWSQKIAIVSVFIFTLWQLFFDGNGLWFDLMLVPFAVLAFFLAEKKKYLWAGVLWALMFFTKQTAVWFLIPIIFEIIQSTKHKPQSLIRFSFGAFIMFASLVALLLFFGILPDFYHWAINFGIFILPKSQGQIQLPSIKVLVVSLFPFLISLPFLLKNKKTGINLVLWVVAGVMGSYPRFEFFHFQPAIPFLAFMSGLFFINLDTKNTLLKTFTILYVFGATCLLGTYFLRNYNEGTRFLEPEVVDVVKYVKGITQPNDRIFVMNWWDNIYPLTNTLPATDPWIPQLSWYQELPNIQEEEVEDIKNSKPKLILLQDYTDSGLASFKPQKVLDFVKLNYKLKEKVDGVEILVPNN